jgi:LuxR family transcriptional regulator, maltose regulon positive regulatory protein
MAELILKTRIKPRRTPDNILSRQRVSNIFLKNSDKNLFFVVSPAGYGKTTAVLDFLNGSNLKYAWFHATEDIEDYYTFLQYLVHAFKNLKPDFGNDTILVISSMKETKGYQEENKEYIKSLAGTFINEFYSYFEEDVWFVIDDFHNIKPNDWINNLFQYLTEDQPENLHIILTSRHDPQFNIVVLEAKRKICKIEQCDLKFDSHEIEDLLKNIYLKDYKGDGVNIFEEKIQGWITGIHLIMQSIGRDISNLKLLTKKLPGNIFEYFANDIFKGLEENTKVFLMKTCLINEFSIQICKEVFEIKNPELIIKYLISRNLFIEQKENPQENFIIYSYHSLFTDFLRNKIFEYISASELEDYIKRLSKFYIDKGEIQNSIEIFLEYKLFAEGTEILSKNYKLFTEEYKYEAIARWLNIIPPEYQNKNPIMLYLSGLVQKLLNGNLEKAKSLFYEAMDLATDDLKRTECLIEISSIEIISWNIKKGIEILEQIQTENKIAVLEPIVMFNLANAYLSTTLKSNKEIIKILDSVLKNADELQLSGLKTKIFLSFGELYHQNGELVKSIYYLDLALKNKIDILTKMKTIEEIILLNSETGNYAEAYGYLLQLEELCKGFKTLKYKRIIMVRYALLHFDAGDFEGAIKHYEELIKLSDENELKTKFEWDFIHLGFAYHMVGNDKKASDYYELAKQNVNEEDIFTNTYLKFLLAIHNRNKVPDIEEEGILLESLNYFEENKLSIQICEANFSLADYYYRTGAYETSLACLKKSLNLYSEKQYFQNVDQLFLEYRYIFDFAIANGIEKPFIHKIRIDLLEACNLRFITDEYKKRLKIQSIKLYDIYLKTFGGIEINIRGNQITEDKWIRKKSKLILIYLLLNPTIRFTKDKIIDMFFPESSVETSDNIFHQILTNIRNATKPYESKSKEKEKTKSTASKSNSIKLFSDFVIYEDKILHLNDDYFYRIDAFEFEKYYNQMKSSESDTDTKIKAAEKAAEIYIGEFLPGIYETWVEDMREIYQNKLINVCEFLMGVYNKKKLYSESINYSEKILQMDKLSEKAYINMIDCYVSAGNSGLAQYKYKQMLDIYEKEYGEKPANDIMERINLILN